MNFATGTKAYYNNAFKSACYSGNLSLLKQYLINMPGHVRFVQKYDAYNICKYVIHGRNFECVDYIVRLVYEGNYIPALNLAYLHGIVDVKKITNPNSILYASSNGDINLIKHAIDCGATDYNCGLFAAITYGNVDVIYFLVQCGANNMWLNIRNICMLNKKDVINALIKCGLVTREDFMNEYRNLDITVNFN